MEEQKYDWMVCVRCYTFNQAPYIEDALNGFTMQQTDFPFVCCIVDDASTDGEQEVIKNYLYDNFDFDKTGQGQLYQRQLEYGTLIFARHKTNHNCYFAVVLLKENHNGSPERKALKRSYIAEWEKCCKYEALCEGDDYWTDPLKLKRQVDFLDSHPEYSMCFHSAFLKYEDGNLKNNVLENNYNTLESREYFINEIHSSFIVPTCSTMYRMTVLENYTPDPDYFVGDNVLWTLCASKGKIYCLGEKMSVYRINNNGWIRRHQESRNIRILSTKKWYKHYRALRRNYPDLKCNQIYLNEIHFASIITYTDIKPLKNIFYNFYSFSKQYKFKYLVILIKNILTFFYNHITKSNH